MTEWGKVSEIVVAALVLVILVNVLVIVLFLVFNALFLVGIVLRLKTANSFVLTRLPLAILCKSVLSLPHLVVAGAPEHSLVLFALVVEDLFLLGLLLPVFELVNDLLLLLPALRILQVIHIQLVLQIVNVCELLDVDRVEPFELGFQTLILLLVLGLNVLDSLEPLLRPLQLLLSPSGLVSELTLVQLQLFDGVLHLSLLLRLVLNDILNALLNVNLLSVGVQVARD